MIHKRYLIGLVVFFLIGAVAYCGFYKPQEEHFEPKVVSFPFSWEEDEQGYLTEITGKSGVVRITVVNITAFGKTIGGFKLYGITVGGLKADEGYQFYGVYVIGKNLQRKEWWCPFNTYVGTDFELKTNRTNLYKSKSGWGDIRFGFGSPMKPEEEEDGWVYFEIREDEKPIELRHYEVINPEASLENRKLDMVYIWEIEDS